MAGCPDTLKDRSTEAAALYRQAEADYELADIKQREVDRLRSRALEMRQRAQRMEREASV